MLRDLAGDFIYGADGFLNKNICGGRSGEGGKTRCLFFPLQILGVTQRFYDPVYPGIKSIRSQYDADKGICITASFTLFTFFSEHYRHAHFGLVKPGRLDGYKERYMCYLVKKKKIDVCLARAGMCSCVHGIAGHVTKTD